MKFLFFLLFLLGSAWAQEATPMASPVAVPLASPQQEEKKSSPNDLAAQAASEKLPQVSASILRTEFQRETDPAQQKKIALRLGEILVTEGHPEEALQVLNSQDLQPDAMVLFWKAQAYLALKKYSEAHALLESSVVSPTLGKEYLEAASIALARSDRALGNFDAALSDLDAASTDLLHKSTSTANFVVVPVQAASEQSKLKDEVKSEASSEKSNASTSTGDLNCREATWAPLALEERCSVLLALKRNTEVEQLLKNVTPQQFSQQPRLVYLFALAAWQREDRAEALRRFSLKKVTEVPLSDHWTSSAIVSGTAACDIALSKQTEAQAVLEKYLQENPRSPRMPDLMAQLEQLYLLENNNDTTLFRKWSKESSQEPLRASYAQLPYVRMMRRLGHNDKADALLLSFLNHFPDHILANQACCELAESKLRQGEAGVALSYLADQPTASPSMRGRIAFLRGLAESVLKHPDRAEKDFSEAAVLDPKLAPDAFYNQELTHLAASQQTKLKDEVESGSKSESFNTATSTDDLNCREAALAVFQEDHGDRASASAVIKSARAFLAAHPQSSFTNEIRMKLGEALLRKGLARDARTELEVVGQAEPSSELGRQALLLAAQAAARSMDPKSIDDAIMLLEQVAQNSSGSNDGWQARLEQASLKNAQALPLEAIAIDDQILAASDVAPELRRTAQMAKGDTLSGLGVKDASNYQAAIATWRDLAGTAEIPPHWRNQALCKIGLIEEKLGDKDAALAAYYEAMKTPRTQEPEILWHDKAAFEAARLLEAYHQWSDAIALYQQIITEGGPRAAEAQARISKLRLENFLWEN